MKKSWMSLRSLPSAEMEIEKLMYETIIWSNTPEIQNTEHHNRDTEGLDNVPYIIVLRILNWTTWSSKRQNDVRKEPWNLLLLHTTPMLLVRKLILGSHDNGFAWKEHMGHLLLLPISYKPYLYNMVRCLLLQKTASLV